MPTESGENIKIVLAVSDPQRRHNIAQIINPPGTEVIEAASAREAVNLIQADTERRIGFLVISRRLEDDDTGRQSLKAIRAIRRLARRDIYIILVVDHTDTRVQKKLKDPRLWTRAGTDKLIEEPPAPAGTPERPGIREIISRKLVEMGLRQPTITETAEEP